MCVTVNGLEVSNIVSSHRHCRFLLLKLLPSNIAAKLCLKVKKIEVQRFT